MVWKDATLTVYFCIWKATACSFCRPGVNFWKEQNRWDTQKGRGTSFSHVLEVFHLEVLRWCLKNWDKFQAGINARTLPVFSSNSEPTQCTMLYSRQGTTETIEEVEAEAEEEVVEALEPEHHDAKDEEYEAEYEAGVEEVSLTPDEEELPQFSTDDGDVEAPPSYSKAVSFEHLSFASQDDTGAKNHMVVSPDDSRTDKLESSILPPLTHELTASDLLMNK